MSLLHNLIYSQQTPGDVSALLNLNYDDFDADESKKVDNAAGIKARGIKRSRALAKRKFEGLSEVEAEKGESVNEVDEAEKEIRTKYFRYRDRYNFHVKSLHLYHNAPEMRFKSKLPTKLHFVPGCSGYLKFPQYERSITTTCRDIIEISLIDCFYAKDFDGAFQALEKLIETVTVRSSELLMFTEMIQYAEITGDNSVRPNVLLELYQHLLKYSIHRKSIFSPGAEDRRISFVQFFLELVLSPSFVIPIDDKECMDAAKSILNKFGTEIPIRGNLRLNRMSIAVHVLHATQEAANCLALIKKSVASTTTLSVCLPTGREVALCPFFFWQVVRLLYCVADGEGIGSDAAEERAEDCTTLRRELKMVFQVRDLQSNIDMTELRIAYYLGTNNPTEAANCLADFRKYILETENDGRTSEVVVTANRAIYYRLLSRFLCFRMRSKAKLPNVDQRALEMSCYLQAVSLWLQCEESLSGRGLQMLVLLYRTGKLPSETLLSIICGAIEKAPLLRPSKSESLHHEESQCFLWLLWMSLANLLGALPLTPPDLSSPILPDSQLFPFFASLSYSSSSSINSSKSQSFGEMENSDTSLRSIFKSERKWWNGTIFSVNNMDEFLDSVLSMEVESIMNEVREMDCAACLNKFDVLHNATIGAPSRSADNVNCCSMFGYEEEFAFIFGDFWQIDVLNDDLGAEPAVERDDNEEFCESDYQEDYHESPEDVEGSIEDDWTPIFCQLAESELFTTFERADAGDHFCCLIGKRSGGFTISIRKEDFFPFDKYVKCDPQPFMDEVIFHRLSDELLEILAAQIVVCSHLVGQDSLFVVRAVQVLMQHALRSSNMARDCLLYVDVMGVNVLRATNLARGLALREVPVCSETAPHRFPSHINRNKSAFGSYKPS